jgi:hypothetical protein
MIPSGPGSSTVDDSAPTSSQGEASPTLDKQAVASARRSAPGTSPVRGANAERSDLEKLMTGEGPAPARFRGRTMDPMAIAKLVAAEKKGAVQLCFERELKRNPNLRGTATVELELQAPSRLAAVRVIDNLKRPKFTECVRSSMRTLSLPAVAEDVEIAIPFRLSTPKF